MLDPRDLTQNKQTDPDSVLLLPGFNLTNESGGICLPLVDVPD